MVSLPTAECAANFHELGTMYRSAYMLLSLLINSVIFLVKSIILFPQEGVGHNAQA